MLSSIFLQCLQKDNTLTSVTFELWDLGVWKLWHLKSKPSVRSLAQRKKWDIFTTSTTLMHLFLLQVGQIESKQLKFLWKLQVGIDRRTYNELKCFWPSTISEHVWPSIMFEKLCTLKCDEYHKYINIIYNYMMYTYIYMNKCIHIWIYIIIYE